MLETKKKMAHLKLHLWVYNHNIPEDIASSLFPRAPGILTFNDIFSIDFSIYGVVNINSQPTESCSLQPQTKYETRQLIL